MKTKIKVTEAETFINRPGWFMFRGAMMFAFGSLLLILSVVAPHMQMLGTSSSWIPVSSAIILLAGILRCIDAFASDRQTLVLMNMQGGMIDLVCGFIIFTNIGATSLTLSLIVAAYLIMQGLYRFMLTFVIEIHSLNSARIGGSVSVLLGLMAWLNWPFSDFWFLSFALSSEIASRGWALMFYANSINKQQKVSQ
ncbi:hypothetical protein AU255_05150 [Methyloprofundus sedimenti]|uniref:Uncharacterized protein n=1 Tax=Methyloprofundus sedimenti TaxID=1420851 RepID=A0A1V8M6Z1_9GAMM|nr:DUF308 domain-containing protein [Methyloprofundus sedimenti]OQK17276.1 hypothetical protein AU255_05150 [Methyloprofundus sedimenti]